MASVYERELKEILQGDERVIRRIAQNLDAEIRWNYLKAIEKPFIVVRAAGSFGIDLIAIRGDISFPIEVKSSSVNVIRFSKSKEMQRQLESFRQECSKAQVSPIYAFRLKNAKDDPWRVFTLEIEGLQGRIKVLNNRIPKLALTASNNYIMRWKEGMPLNVFLAYLC